MNPIRPLLTLSAGLRDQADRVSRAADTLVRQTAEAQTAVQNAEASDSVSISPTAASTRAVEDAMQHAVLPPEGDVTTTLADLIQARLAYTAQTRAVQVTADVVQDSISVTGRREV